MIWSCMSSEKRLAAITELARAGNVEREIQEALSAPVGAVRNLAVKHGVILTKASEKRAQSRPAHDKRPATVWDLDDNARRLVFAARARKGAHNTLKTLRSSHA